MKRKRRSAKPKPKKLSVAADVVVDPQYYSDVNEDNDKTDSRMEILAREACSHMSGRHAGLDEPVVNNETAGSAAAKLARVIESSRSKATSDKVAIHHVRIGEKEPKSSQRGPAYDKQELDAALSVIKKIMKMNGATPFCSPVDPIALGIPDYFDIIDTPMDFGTICSNLEKGLEYRNSEDVFKDVQRIWDNCRKYNKKGSSILELMKRVKNNFMKQWTAAGLYKEQQTVSNGYLPHNPELDADSTIRHEEAMHAYPVGSTVSSHAHLQRQGFSYLNRMQYQPLSPSCSGMFTPHHIPYQCPCSLHPGQSQLGHHQHDLAPHHSHQSHFNSVDHMNDYSCNQWVNKANPNLMHSSQPSSSYYMTGHPQQRAYLHPSSSSQLPPSQLQSGRNTQSAALNSGRDTGAQNYQQHQMGSVHVQAYQPFTNCMPAHEFDQNTSQQLHSSRTEGGRNIGFAGRNVGDQDHQLQMDSVHVQAYQPSSNCMPAHEFNQKTSQQLHSSRTEGGRNIGFAGRNAGDQEHQQHQMDSVRVQTYQPLTNCMPAHEFNQNTSQQLHSSRSEGGRNIGFAGNLGLPLPTESTMNGKRDTGCSRPPLTVNSSCQQPDQINSSGQSSSMMNIETCQPLQPESSPSEPSNSTSYNNFSMRETQGQEVAQCQEQSSSMKNNQESQPEGNNCHKTSIVQSLLSPSLTDCMKSKKKSGRRGRTRGLCLNFIEGVRISVTTNEQGQPIGPEAQKLSTFLGIISRNGEILPLAYHDWRAVPSEYKENVWKEVELRFEIDPTSKDSIMQSIGNRWRNWKSELKVAHYYPHETDEERLADRDERVPPDQWAALIALWNTESMQERSAKNRAIAKRHKYLHVTGSKSFARIREEQRANRPDGKEPSRAELFILTRTRKDGKAVNEETGEVIRQLQDGLKESTPQDSNKPSDLLSEILGPDKNVRTCGGTPLTKAKTLSEATAEIRDMKDKMAAMEQNYATVSSQLAAMMSMLSSIQGNLPDKNVPDMIASTSRAADQLSPQQEPTRPSPCAGSNRKTRRGKRKI